MEGSVWGSLGAGVASTGLATLRIADAIEVVASCDDSSISAGSQVEAGAGLVVLDASQTIALSDCTLGKLEVVDQLALKVEAIIDILDKYMSFPTASERADLREDLDALRGDLSMSIAVAKRLSGGGK